MSSPRLDRRALLRALAPGALAGGAVGAGVLLMLSSSPISWWLGSVAAVGVTLGCAAVGVLVRLRRHGTESRPSQAARALGWSQPRLFGVMPATILAVWVPVLLMESDPSTRRFALVVSLSLAGMAPTVVSAWLWWRYEASVAHST